MKLNNYKLRLKEYCNYSNYVHMCTDSLFDLIPSVVISDNELVNYGTLFWFVSKFIEDERLPITYYTKVSGISKSQLFKCELLVFDYYLKYQYHLNPLIFKGSGTSLPGDEISIFRGVTGPDTLRSGPPGVSNPGLLAASDSKLST